MKIEIENLIRNKTNHSFWGMNKCWGMDGGHTKISLNDGTCYEFNLQELVFYIVHRSYGKGFTKKIKKNEEGN